MKYYIGEANDESYLYYCGRETKKQNYEISSNSLLFHKTN